eukprot:COSAG01_NODE_791_length_13556_cov_214.163930_7_plen_71_part_00
MSRCHPDADAAPVVLCVPQEMEAAVGRKELRTEALEGQVSGLRAAVQRLREGNGNERARTAQVQADLEVS